MTERQSTQAELRASETRYRRLFEAARDGILILNATSLEITDVNPYMTELLGYSRAEFLGKELWEIGFFSDKEASKNAFRELQETGYLRYDDLPLQTKRGESRQVEFVSNVYRENGHQVIQCNIRNITERKHSEEAQKERTRILDLAPVLIRDLNGKILYWNTGAEQMYGWTSEEAVGKVTHSLFRTEFPRPIEEINASLFANGHWEGELVKTKRDGQRIVVVSRWALHKNELGEPTAVLEVNNDITERRQAEDQLRSQLDFNEAITSSLGEGVCVFDKSGRVTFMNPAAQIALGWTEGELVGQEIQGIIHLQHADGGPMQEDESPVLGVLRSGQTTSIENDVFTRKNGTTFPVSYTSSAIITRGQVVGAVVAFRDIAERKRAEKTLLQSEERYRLLFERNPQPIWVFDRETLSFLEVNDAATQHYGYSREEFLAMTIKDIRLPQDTLNLLANISTVTPHGQASIWQHKKKDGTLIDVEIAAHELTFYGRPAEIVLAFDVTERRTLEEELRQAQKMEAVGLLAGGVAHDFNNLLTVINGYCELTLRRLQGEDDLINNLEEIKKAGSRAASLTRQLLAFGRKQVLQPKVLDLNAVILDLERMLTRLIGEDVELRTVLKPELRQVNADPGQIEQVIMNLVVNARDAMPEGGKLTIETENVYLTEEYGRHHVAAKPGPYVMFAVSDSGSGMNDETKARVFEPFFTTKAPGKGTGLGLSTVYGIVKQSMGTVWVYSEVGSGTTFKVYLPAIDEKVDNIQSRQNSQQIAPGTETILLVEDDQMVRGLTRKTLEEAGYKVLQAADGSEALMIGEHYPDAIHLLLTDVVMPGMSGRTVSDRLKTLRPQILVLYMSGYTEDAIVHRGVLNEGVNFIEKPFGTAALTRKVRDLLDA